MGKKRGKDRSSREDSIDLTGPSCSHIRKGIERSLFKKTALDENWTSCQDCKDEEHTEPPSEDETNTDPPVIWMCLKCGHRGCGRNSESQHAIKHSEKPRSDPHCLVLSLDNWSVWCYICDDDVQYSNTGQLAQLLTIIKKQALSDSSKMTPAKVKVEDGTGEVAEEVKPEIKPEVKPEVKPEEEKENKDNQKKSAKKDGVVKGQKPGSLGSSGAVSVKGFSNLGNTCFFNAVLQNLSQTELLRQVLNDMMDEKTSLTITPSLSTELEPLQVQLDRPGSLTLAMCQLLNEVQETKKGVVTPSELFAQVCKKAARFKGFQQQDSQELLRYLLDGMRAEETKRVSSGILEALKGSGKSEDPERSKTLIKEYEKNGAPKNFVDQVFGGEMTSTVMCKECKTVSLVTELFLDLSLPVSDEAYRKKNLKKGAQKNSVSSDDGGRDSPTPMTNGTEDLPTGAGSKYQQKKAKKQAKKQAKNQRRQQKHEGKVSLNAPTYQDAKDDASEAAETAETEAAETAETEAAGKSEGGDSEDGVETNEKPQDDACQSSPAEPTEQDRKKTSETSPCKEEDEAAGASEQAASTVSHRSMASTDGQDTEDVSAEDEKEEEDGMMEEETVGPTAADQLAGDLNGLSLDVGFIEDPDSDAQNGDAHADAKEYTVVNQDPELAFRTLATRAAPAKLECSVQSCLFQFTEVENLTQNNRLLCVTCTKCHAATKISEGSKKSVYRDALKQMLISSPPPVLTLHLKRFQQIGYSVCKVNRHVQFPQILDLAPFCAVNCKRVVEGETKVQYSLYGIVEHSGTMRSGHYTAYVKARPCSQTALHNGVATQGDAVPVKGSWYHVSDSSVTPATEAKAQSSQAYLLFYERIPSCSPPDTTPSAQTQPPLLQFPINK